MREAGGSVRVRGGSRCKGPAEMNVELKRLAVESDSIRKGDKSDK